MLAALAGATPWACGGSGSPLGGAGGQGGGGGAVDAGQDVETGVGGGGQGGGACVTEEPYPWPEGIPEDWIPMPCSSASCGAFMAPSPEFARPPSPWASCGDGCLELVADWSTPDHRILVAVGASDGRRRTIAYSRDLGGDPYYFGGPWELQVVNLPENEVVFDAIALMKNKDCQRLDPHAVGGGYALLELTDSSMGNASERQRMVWTVPLSGKPPMLSYQAVDGLGISMAAVSSSLWGVSYQYQLSLQWHGIQPAAAMNPAWISPPQKEWIDQLSAHEDFLFFGPWIWDQAGGGRKLVSFASPTEGAACGMTTDGKSLVWQESHDLDPVTQKWADTALMISPFATDAASLAPVRLRSIVGGGDCRMVVGGGYVLAREGATVTVTRLSDGAFWTIPSQPGFTWGYPFLYVDAEELALIESGTAETLTEAGVYGEQWTLVRRTIASLGKPTPAEP